MHTCGFLRRLAVFSLAALALGGGASQPANASTGCPDYPLGQPFLPWLDLASYTLVPNGGLESGSSAWSLSGGAKVVSGNESFYARSTGDKYSLSLPSSSSAWTSTTCVEVLDGTMRLFAINTGSLLSTLKIEVLYKDTSGKSRADTIALLTGIPSWQPSVPSAFLANLKYPPLLTDGKVDVAFRFTPQGGVSGWRIDDVYVDPFKGS
jgi:hypothetical protein